MENKLAALYHLVNCLLPVFIIAIPTNAWFSNCRYVNSTDLNVHIDDLKPNTEYEFSVKVLKGRRKSVWSLSVFNKTFEAAPATAPRDLTPVAVEGKPHWVSLNWQPPRQPNGQVTGESRGRDGEVIGCLLVLKVY